MNPHQLVIAAIIAIALIGLFFFNFASYFTPQTSLSKHAPSLLLEAQGKLGTPSSVTLSLKQGDTIYARNLDQITRTVSFACSGEKCCDTLAGCPYPISVTPDRILIHQSIQTTLTARCETINQLHVCKLYIGKAPAQVGMTLSLPSNPFTIQGATNYPIQATLYNYGETDMKETIFTATLIQEQIIAGKKNPISIFSTQTSIPEIKVGKKENVVLTFPLTQTGEFQITLRAQAEDGGFVGETNTILIQGNNAQLCQIDLTKNESAQFDGIDNVCRKKVFCTGCEFAYQCTDAWGQEPLTGSSATTYENGAPQYTYQVWPSIGTC
jgi:hypothetical protein